jgi:hypothetical protein
VAQPVRRDERQQRQTAQGPGAGERHAQAAAGRRGAGAGRTQGDFPGNLLSPERRRAAVHHLMRTMKVSERFACRLTGRTDPPSGGLQPRPRQLTRTPDYAPGCGRGPRIIPGAGFVLPITGPAPRVERQPQEDPAAVAPRVCAATARTPAPGRSQTTPNPPTADAPNVVWAVDFQFDATTDARPIKIVSIVDGALERHESGSGGQCGVIATIDCLRLRGGLSKIIKTHGRCYFRRH